MMILTPDQILKSIKFLTSMDDFTNHNPSSEQLIPDWEQYIHQRMSVYAPEMENREYQALSAKKSQLQTMLLQLIKTDKLQEAHILTNQITDLNVSLEVVATEYLFERGILEGFLLAHYILGPMILNVLK